MNKSKNTYTLSILAAGCLWGFMGLFRRYMGEAGFSSSGVIVLRCGVAALCFALTLLLTGPSQFRVRLRDAWCFFGSGVVSLLFFTFCILLKVFLKLMACNGHFNSIHFHTSLL